MRLSLLKGLLWLVCASHLSLGLAGVLSPALAVDAARVFYGAQVESTPALVHMLRIIGAYMVAIGMLGAFAARDPEKNRSFVLVIAVLLAIRVIQRMAHAGEIQGSFGVSSARIWLQSGWFAFLSGALLYLMPRRTSIS